MGKEAQNEWVFPKKEVLKAQLQTIPMEENKIEDSSRSPCNCTKSLFENKKDTFRMKGLCRQVDWNRRKRVRKAKTKNVLRWMKKSKNKKCFFR